MSSCEEENLKLTSRSPIIKVTSAYSMESNKEQDLATANKRDIEAAAGGQQHIVTSSSASAASTLINQTTATTKPQLVDAPRGGQIENATHAYKRRWLVLAIFCAHSAINSFQWIQYSSITNIVSRYYGVSNLEVNLTSLIYMITYIPFIIHASLMLERIGLRYSICLGAFGTALGSILKLELGDAPTSLSFWSMMIGQTIVALSQLYIISIPPLLAAVWFPDNQVSTATGIGVFGNQLGIALGFIVPPLLISNPGAPLEQIGAELRSLEFGIVSLSVAIFLIALLFIKDRPPKPPGSASLHAANQQQQQLALLQTTTATTTTNRGGGGGHQHMETFASISQLSGDKDFRLLTLSYGINVGCFYAVSTVLNQMISKSWPNPDDLAGTMGLLIVVFGMLGSIMCGQLLDRTHAFKLIIVLIYLLSLVSLILFAIVLLLRTTAWPLYLASMTLGFFMTGYLPLGFEFAAEITYPHPANTPAGLLNLSAQIFGLILTYGSSLIVDKDGGDLWANIFLIGCLAVGLALTGVMKADLKRQKAVAEEQSKL